MFFFVCGQGPDGPAGNRGLQGIEGPMVSLFLILNVSYRKTLINSYGRPSATIITHFMHCICIVYIIVLSNILKMYIWNESSHFGFKLP